MGGPFAPATGVAGAGILGAGGEAARQLIRRMAFPNDPSDPATSLDAAKGIMTEGGKQALFQGVGEGAGLVAKGGGKLAGKVLGIGSPTTVEGIPMLASEQSGSKVGAGIEQFLSKSLPSSGVMSKFRDVQQLAINRKAADIATRISTFSGTPEELGKTIQTAVQDGRDAMKAHIDGMYRAIDDMTAGKTVRVSQSQPFTSSIVDELGNPMIGSKNVLVPTQVGGVKVDARPIAKVAVSLARELQAQSKLLDPKLLGDSQSILNNLISNIRANPSQSFQAVQAARSDMIAIARNLEQPSSLGARRAGLVKKLTQVTDDVMESAASKAEASGQAPGLLSQVRAANAANTDLHRKFNTTLFTQLLDKNTPLETMSNLVKNSSLSDIRDLRATIGNDKTQLVTGKILQDIMSEASGQPLTLAQQSGGMAQGSNFSFFRTSANPATAGTQSRFIPSSGAVPALSTRNMVNISGSKLDSVLNGIGNDKLKLLLGGDYPAVNTLRNVVKNIGPGGMDDVNKLLGGVYTGAYIGGPAYALATLNPHLAMGMAGSAGFVNFTARVLTNPDAASKIIGLSRALAMGTPRTIEAAAIALKKMGESDAQLNERTGRTGGN